MENITIEQIVSAIGSITAIAVFFIAIFKWYKSHITDKFNTIDKEIADLKRAVKSHEADMKESIEERFILLKGLLACLEGLKQGGANGPVTKAIEEINEYLINKTHNN